MRDEAFIPKVKRQDLVPKPLGALNPRGPGQDGGGGDNQVRPEQCPHVKRLGEKPC